MLHIFVYNVLQMIKQSGICEQNTSQTRHITKQNMKQQTF